RPVTFQVRSVREGDTLRWVAEAQILMTDFGVEPPSIVGLISVEEEVQLVVQVTARAAGDA
ncbi:MAG: hypothetical protein C0P78_009890, partial [Bacillota bacterium]